MNDKIPHALGWGFVPYGEGKELYGYITVRLNIVDTNNSRSKKEMLSELKTRMARVIECEETRLVFQPPIDADSTPITETEIP